jgi:DNA polymerase-3 subunit delta
MKPILALTGANELFKREHLARILKDVPKDEVTVYFADDAENSVIFNQCSQDSLFGSRNIVVVRNIAELSDKESTAFEETLEKYLNAVNENSVLVLFADKFSPGLTALIRQKGELIEFKKAYRNELVGYITRKFRDAGARHDADLPDFLVTLCNEDSDDAEMMVTLLTNYAAGGKVLTIQDAESLLSRSNNMNIFDLIEGIFTRNARKALNALNDLRLAGEGLPRISYMVLRSAKNLWGYLSLSDKKDAETVLGIKFFETKRLSEFARASDMKFVSSVIGMVKRLEFRTKSMAEDLAYLEMETFILANSRSAANARVS